jgi:hypothetical protein
MPAKIRKQESFYTLLIKVPEHELKRLGDPKLIPEMLVEAFA